MHPVRLLAVASSSAVLVWLAPGAFVRACDVGDPRSTPRLVITAAPPDCCYADAAGSIAGTVSNVDTEQVCVVVYAMTDVYYVQPVLEARVIPSCGGVWSTTTHGGMTYAAILARRSWSPPATLTQLPPVGGPILAVTCAPESQRRLDFAGRRWVVKSSGDVPFGPGPNVWSDSPENVWVDADGLHLRLAERDGRWTCAEVMSEFPVGYGRLRFEVEGPIDAMDPQVVFAGFFYADGGAEADIEWSRWGDAASPTNAQYAVQPDAVRPLSLALGGGTSTHAIHWSELGIDFASWPGVARGGSPPLASWSHGGSNATPRFERVHFNLWLVDGAAPAAAVEVVIRAFESDDPSAVMEAWAGAPRLETPAMVRGSVPYSVELARTSSITLRLFDPRGRMVHEVRRGTLSAGTHRGRWSPGADGVGLAQGLYFLRLEARDGAATSRLVYLR